MILRPKLMMAAGIAVAGLGLIGAGAGATFTAQVAGHSSVTTGEVGLSLNGGTGRDLDLDVAGHNLGTHFQTLTKELRLKNTGTLDLATIDLHLTAAGCQGGDGAPLAHSLWATLTDVTHSRQVYDGDLCSTADQLLLHPLPSGETVLYDLVLRPHDVGQGLPSAALDSRTSVRVVVTGYDH